MSKKTVVFQNLDEIVRFVHKTEKYPFDMDMKRGKFIVDAKSLLGIVNMGFNKEIELKVYMDDCHDFWKDIEEFVAA